MKKMLLAALAVVGVMAWAQCVEAQPAVKRILVSVSPDHSDWTYKLGQQAQFTVTVSEHANQLEQVAIDYELGPEGFPEVKKQNVVLKDGKATFKATLNRPGFLRCKVTAKRDGKEYVGLATVAYEPEKIEPSSPNPADFDQFWSETLAQAAQVPLDAQMTLLPELCTSTQNVYQASFQVNRANSRMYGILVVPKRAGKYPAVLQVPGAGVYQRGVYNLGDSIITFNVGIHGVPVNMPAEVYRNLSAGALDNYASFNRNDRFTHYYRRVYTGCAKAVDFLLSLPECNGTVGVTGGSQGGALSVVTAALNPKVRFLSAYYPALCDFAGYLNGRAGGWPHYYRSDKPAPGEVENLAYFDVVNFARRLSMPARFTWGYNDVTCPPTSMQAAYNVIPGEKELHIYPDTGHWTYPEQSGESADWLRAQCFGR